jgi:hypothetical protein
VSNTEQTQMEISCSISSVADCQIVAAMAIVWLAFSKLKLRPVAGRFRNVVAIRFAPRPTMRKSDAYAGSATALHALPPMQW